MKTKRVVRGKRLEGTPYLISEEEKLGKGTYGEVYRAYNRDNPSEQLVVKIISLLEYENKQTIQTELEMIRELPRHENLVNCVKARIESEHNLYIIMEYCNQGSLEQYIKKMTLLPQEKIWDIITQICKGYQVLYDAHLLHRDIKPQNILIHNRIFKLADFGLSKRIKSHTINENLSYAGSPLYIAPEIIDKHEGTSKIDIFSLGSVIYELAYDGANPFYKESDIFKNHYEYYERRKKVKLNLPPKNKKGEPRSQELRKLIAKMLQFDEQKRISWEQIFSHPKIDINTMKMPQLQRVISQQEQILEQLKNSLVQVRKSSAKMEPIEEKDNIRSQSQHLTLQLISFEQFLEHSELRTLENVMLRLKITELTILHCNLKINNVIRQNQKHRQLHKHISEGLERIVIEGLLYLLKINQLIRGKISGYQECLMSDLLKLLEKDRQMLIDQFKREAIIFKHLQLQKQLQTVEKYDLRVYQNQLYSILTEYCDYPVDAKQKVSVVISLLLDIYDSSLKLNDLIDQEKVTWQKYQDISEIQTKMDEFCYNRLEPHEFYSYLMKKEHIKPEDNHHTLKKLGLLFA